jgi:hypothetical protein
MNTQQNANVEKAYEIANSYDGDTCDSLDITTACLGMANWKDEQTRHLFQQHIDEYTGKYQEDLNSHKVPDIKYGLAIYTLKTLYNELFPNMPELRTPYNTI